MRTTLVRDDAAGGRLADWRDAGGCWCVGAGGRPAPAVLFVTQPPFGNDFATVNAVFGNHRAETGSTPRGGDL